MKQLLCQVAAHRFIKLDPETFQEVVVKYGVVNNGGTSISLFGFAKRQYFRLILVSMATNYLTYWDHTTMSWINHSHVVKDIDVAQMIARMNSDDRFSKKISDHKARGFVKAMVSMG